eukprot:337122-Lingulodinium_polyedra.AAC.1
MQVVVNGSLASVREGLRHLRAGVPGRGGRPPAQAGLSSSARSPTSTPIAPPRGRWRPAPLAHPWRRCAVSAFAEVS